MSDKGKPLNSELTTEQKRIINRPSVVAEALGGTVKVETVLSWLQGYRSIPIVKLDEILRCFPHVDGRWFCGQLARRYRERHDDG